MAEPRVTTGAAAPRPRRRRSSAVVRVASVAWLLTLAPGASAQEDTAQEDTTQHGAWTSDPAVEDDVRDLLGDTRRFRYCHEAGYQLWPHEKSAYCDQAEELSERCPGLARACQLPAYGTVSAREEVDFDLDWSWLRSGAAFVRVLFWIVLAVGVALLLRALARNLAEEMRRRRGSSEVAPEIVEWTPAEPELPRETDAERLLSRAREQATRGDFTAALASAYAAALWTLEQRGLVELHRSRTNGDYLRQLATHPTERAAMRRIVREVEAVQFGQTPADRARFEALLTHVTSLLGRASVWLALVLLPLGTTACGSENPPEAPHAAHGPDGYALLEALLQRHSATAQRRVRRITGSLEEVATFVALSPALRAEEWDLLMDRVAAGGTLVTAGIPEPLAELLQSDVQVRPCAAPVSVVHAHPPGGSPPDDPETSSSNSPPRPASTDDLSLVQAGAGTFEAFPGARSVVACGDRPFLVSIEYGAGSVYALADDVWLRNANLGAADNAQVIVQLAAAPGSKVELLGPWTGSGAHHPLESIHRAGLTPWLLQLLLLGLAYALSRGVRFGTPREPVRDQRRSFVEHADALADQYARRRASGHALEQYGRWALERIRERVPVRDRDLHALSQAVARRTGGEPMAILGILVEAQSAGQIQGAPEEHSRTMEALSRILRDVGGA